MSISREQLEQFIENRIRAERYEAGLVAIRDAGGPAHVTELVAAKSEKLVMRVRLENALQIIYRELDKGT